MTDEFLMKELAAGTDAWGTRQRSSARAHRGPAQSDIEPLRLPRAQEGPRPQHLIITLFGDYWFGRPEMLPSASLVAIAEEFGISAASARAALSRLGRRGLMESTKVGRRTFYGPTARTKEVMLRAQDRIFTFGIQQAKRWDGQWLLVAFSVPEERREMRHTLRRRLRWLGFAPIYDGVWVSARPVAGDTEAMIRECGIKNAIVFTATTLYSTMNVGPRHDPLSAWDLTQLRTIYQDFIERFEPVLQRISSGAVGASEALVERTAIMDAWRSFPGLDPELPDAVLPEDWPRARAHEIFANVYDALGPLAEMRFKQILSRHAPDLTGLVGYYTTATAREVAMAQLASRGVAAAGIELDTPTRGAPAR